MMTSVCLVLCATIFTSGDGPAFELNNIEADLLYYKPGEFASFDSTANGTFVLTTFVPCTIEFFVSPFCYGPECVNGMIGGINLGLEDYCSCDCTSCGGPFYADWIFRYGPSSMLVDFERGERPVNFTGVNMSMVLKNLYVDEDPFTYCRSDTNIDGVVDFADLLQVINNWGSTCE